MVALAVLLEVAMVMAALVVAVVVAVISENTWLIAFARQVAFFVNDILIKKIGKYVSVR